jgi:hypothetical protein
MADVLLTVRQAPLAKTTCNQHREVPMPSQKDCGDGVSAGPNTSCPFAKNVRDEYFAVPGDSVEIEVFSPVTGKTYTMNCVKSGRHVTCRGGNEAVVTFTTP